MGHCSVIGCRSNQVRDKGLISFHCFPSDDELRNKWIASMGRTNWTPRKHSHICSFHFDADVIINTGKSKHLLPHAVPTKCLNNPKVKVTQGTPICKGAKRKRDVTAESEHVPPPPKIQNLIEVPTVTSECRTVNTNNAELKQESNNKDKVVVCDLNSWKEMNEAIVMANAVSKILREKLEKQKQITDKQRKKLKILRIYRSRLIQKVAKLENVLMELGTDLLINEEETVSTSKIEEICKINKLKIKKKPTEAITIKQEIEFMNC